MNFETLPIDRFISQMIVHPRIVKVTSEWRVEPVEMVKILVSYFRDIGWFYVDAHNNDKALDLAVDFLKVSPEIATLIRRAELAELDRKKKVNVG